MERGVGEQQPDRAGVGGDLRSQGRTLPAAHQHHRPLRGGEERPLGAGEERHPVRRGQVGDHHGERLLLPPLALPERPHRGRRRGVAGQVVPADALHREDAPRGERGPGVGHRVAARGRRAVGAQERHARTAGRTGVGLGVEAPVGRVAVLALAVRAHAEGGHGRGRTVVGHVAHDGEARAAAGAVRERIVKSPVGRVQHLGEAVGAGGEVGRDGDPPLVGAGALLDQEGPGLLGGDLGGPEGGHPRRGWPSGAKPRLEGVEGGRRPEGLHGDAGVVVADPPGDAAVAGRPPDEGAHAHALHGAADLDAPAAAGRAHGATRAAPRIFTGGERDCPWAGAAWMRRTTSMPDTTRPRTAKPWPSGLRFPP